MAAVVLTYQPAWSAGFIWDDDAHITPPQLRSLQGLLEIWFVPGTTQQYYPLTESLFWFQYKLWGEAPAGYHFTNILLHAGAAVLLALVLRRLGAPGALLAAAIFALHPVHVESVAWVTEQKNTLSTVFYLGAVLAYLHFDEHREIKPYLKALGLGVLAILSKVVSVTLPFALLVILWWRRGRLSWKRDVLPVLPLLAAGAVVGWISARVEGALVRPEAARFELSLVEQVLVAGRASWFYLSKLLWPVDLLFFYPRWEVSEEVWWQYTFPAAGLLLLSGLWWLRTRSRAPIAALLFFVLTLSPVLGFLDVYAFIYSFVADHWQYVASMGPIALLGASAATLLQRHGHWGKRAGNSACLALLAVLAVLTFRQGLVYADNETLYRESIEGNPESFIAHNNLAGVLFMKGHFEESIQHAEAAARLMPDSYETHFNLALSLESAGRAADAIEHFATAARLEPKRFAAHLRLGVALMEQGRAEEAATALGVAVELEPSATTYYELGRALSRAGRDQEAIGHYEKALSLNPEACEVYNNLGSALARTGRLEDAIEHYKDSLRLCPDHPRVRENLAKVQAMLSK